MKKKAIVAAVTTATLVWSGLAMADSHHKLKVKKSIWDARGQKLVFRVKAGEDTSFVRAFYGGRTFTLKAKNRDKGIFVLWRKGVCYDNEVKFVTSRGESLTTRVRARGGSTDGYQCAAPDPQPTDPGQTGSPGDVVVFASNDLGMHCACPGSEYFMILPPYNTLRAQVVKRGEEPKVLTAADGITVTYRLLENTDASLKDDPYYAAWLENMPKYGFGQGIRADGRIQGISGATLSGDMQSQDQGWWEVKGVPSYPDVSLSPASERVMTDPLGGPNRNPFITAKVEVHDRASGAKLAETTTVVPVAFSGCCNCHLQVTRDHGLAPTEANSFKLMGQLHKRSSGIDFATLDPDGDGVPGPIRCSVCHLDPAMGEQRAPGYPGLPTSRYTLSNVIHRWHVENPEVLAYDADLATDCYACHPGNNVGCFRGVHADKGLWCTDCHGDLNQRVAEGQVDKPWSADTLPKCEDCHQGTGEGKGWVNAFAGSYLNSRGHKDNKILCSSCHGSPHSLYPSTLAKDNQQPLLIQGSESAIGNCSVCHTNEGDSWRVPPHGDTLPSLRAGGGSSGGSTGGGTTGSIDAAGELQTTCRSCHGDKSAKVNCGNGKWLAHNGSRVSSAVFAAVSNYLTGSTCGASSSGSTGSGSSSSGIDPAAALNTTCLSCHGDKSAKVSCGNGKWLAHNGSRVSSAVFAAVSNYLTGSTCGASSSGSTGSGSSSSGIDPAAALNTTCLSCHGDRSAKVSCGNEDWLEHRGKRVSAEVFDAVEQALIGNTCQGANSGEEDDD